MRRGFDMTAIAVDRRDTSDMSSGSKLLIGLAVGQ